MGCYKCGTAVLLATLVTDASQDVGGGLIYFVYSPPSVEPKRKSYRNLYVVSAALTATGIGLLISSGKMKRKATAINTTASFKMEKVQLAKGGYLQTNNYPALRVQVCF